MKNNQTIVANIVLAESSVSSLALHQEAVEFFANGGTIGKAASAYAGASDTFYHRAIVWVIQSGFNLLPANDKGKAPSIKEHMEAVSSDSKNAARAMLQEVYSLAWQASQKGLDPLAFASLRAMRDGVRAKDKTLPNDTVNAGIIPGETAVSDFVGPVEQVGEGAETFHRVASTDIAAMLQEIEVLAMLKAELAVNRPSVRKLRQLCGIAV